MASHPGTEIHVQEDAGHTFHNRVAHMFYRPEAAQTWALTVEFPSKT